MTTELKRLERRLAVVSQIARVMSASLGLDELMKVTYEAIAPFFTHQVFSVLRYHSSEDSLRVLFTVAERGDRAPTKKVSLGGLNGAVVREDRAIYIPDLEKRHSSVPDPIAVGPDNIQGSWLGVPLRIRQQVMGVLSISTEHKNAYPEEDEQLLATVADQLAVAIDNARLFEDTRRQAERLALLNRISRVVNAKLNLTDLFDALYREIETSFDHDEFYVVLHDRVANELNVLFGVMSGSKLGPARLPFGGLSGLVIETGKTLHIRHFTAEKDNLPVPHTLLGETSIPETWLGVPLVVGKRVLGILCMMKNLPSPYTPAKVKLLETIADQIALAVSNAEQFKSLRGAAERLGIVNRIGRVIGREQDLNKLAETVHREIAPVFEADTFYIALYNETESTIEFPFMVDERRRVIIDPIPYGEGLTSRVIRTKQTLHTHNPDEYSSASGVAISYGSQKDPVSWLGIPLMIEGSVIGVINVQSYRSNAYTDEQELLLQTIADQVAISFERARLFRQAKREIEDRQMAEARLEEEKSLLRTIINHIPDLIYSKDLEGRYVVANSAIARFFGFDTTEHILGKTIGDLFPEDKSIGYLEEEQQIVVSGKEIVNQEEHVEDRTSGKARWLLVTKMRLLDSHNNPVGIVGIDRDITARKIAEEEIKRYLAEVEIANDEVKAFAYIVSHDLRAPLVNLKGFSAELKDSMEILSPHLQKLIEALDESEREDVVLAVEEDIPEALGFIETSVSRMDGFINSVLKLSRIGRRELSLQPVDVAGFVETCRQSLAHQMEEKHVELIVEDLPQVLADPTALEQVIGNLLTNAVNYLDPERPGRVEIGGEKTQLGTRFWVKDNGRGISKDDEEKVFAPFRRAGKQNVKGEGMGLSYVRTMVRQHGGQIWFESEPDVGTTFFFTIADQKKEGTS